MAKQPAPTPETRPPAYFLSLTVENVRCFGPKQTLNLSDSDGKPARWTVILGENGTGKTTALQLLAGVSQASQHFSKFPKFYFDVLMSDDHCSTFISSRNPQHVAHIAIFVTQALSKESRGIELLNVTFHAPELKKSNSIELNADFRVPIVAYGAGRRLGSISLSDTNHDDATATLFSDQANLRNPEEWLLRLDYAAKSATGDKQQAARLEKAKELLLAVMPENVVDDIRFATTSGPNPVPRVEFKTPYGWVPLRQLGYGYQTLITWVADLANRMAERYPDSADPLAEPAVVLVDEIDLHLHPRWQRTLMTFLLKRFPQTQFIVTAHSPLIAQAAADANLVVFRREGDHVVIDNDVDNIRNWRVDQILTSSIFGLTSARPPQIEAMLEERKQLLTKPKLTAKEKKRVAELEAQIGLLPYGETSSDIQLLKDIQDTLNRLEQKNGTAP